MIEKLNIRDAQKRIKSSPTIKLVLIGLITLILLIPASMVRSIISEREMLSRQAISEVSEKWARSQVITGPILSIPYTRQTVIGDKISQTDHKYHILPDRLDIDGSMTPERLNRGIYEIVVYKSSLGLSGVFNLDEISKLSGAHEIKWKEAFVTFGISDLRGIENELSLAFNNESLSVEPGSKISPLVSSGITITAPLEKREGAYMIDYKLMLELNGSANLSFVPVGGITEARLNAPWKAPSFNGDFLPDHREVTSEGFEANWKMLELNRNYPQSWSDYEVTQELESSKFGVDLLLPMDDYQKSLRSAKYAILILSLTFLVFFLVEVMNHKRIHPFQYTLVGLALTLFYILLVSISEHSSFDLAYFISAVCIIVMITAYSITLFRNTKLSVVLAVILIALYGFLFVILQLVDYALLVGSIGLALILGATMYFTKNIDWYQMDAKEKIV